MTALSSTSRVLTLVFTDLADSTALKTQRGDDAVAALMTQCRDHVARLTAECGGRVIDWAGDGCFLTFESSSAAVLFGLRLQEIHHGEPALPRVRVGIHMGEVTEKPFEGSVRVEGLIVDLAARISGLAAPGQVLVSSAVHQNARQRLTADVMSRPLRWATYGFYSLKGFDEPIDVREAGLDGISPFSAPPGGEKAWPVHPDGDTREQDAIRKIAVLPFTNFADAPGQDWFVDGMTETLIAELAKIKALTVISRTSVMHYKNTTKPLREIGRDLGVHALVEGSVMRAGNRVRITAQLIDAKTDVHLWADRYDGTMEEVLDLQGEVALAIARQVNVTLTPEEAAPLKHARPVVPEAFDELMKCKQTMTAISMANVEAGAQHIQKALAIDPEYTDAYATMAAYYAHHVSLGTMGVEKGYFQARIAAQEAIRRGGESTDALWALAHVTSIVEWDWDRSLQFALRAEKLNASQSEILSVIGANYGYKGNFVDAHRYLDRAIEADPLDPRHYTAKGCALIAERRYDEAVEFNLDAKRRFPDFITYRSNIIASYLGKGALTEACRFADEYVAMPAEQMPFAALEVNSLAGITYVLARRNSDAEALFETLKVRHHRPGAEPPSGLGFMLLALGREDEAYPLLERSYRVRNYMFLWFNITHVFELLPFPIDDRIQRILARMKISSSPW